MMDESLEARRLAARLRRTRLERGLSLRGAAAKIGVTKETLSDLERARRHPHPPTLAKIAEGYGVEVSDLLGPMVEEEPVPAGKAEASETGPDIARRARSEALRQWEQGHKAIARAIADAFGFSVADLMEEPQASLAEAASEAGPPQVSQEELAAQGIRATDAEVAEVNYTIADFWRLVRGGQPVAYFRHDDVDPERVWMLIDLVLDTPSVVTPEAAGVVRQGMREKLKTG